MSNGQKSVWKSKSFLTGVGALVTALTARYGILLEPVVIEGILSLISAILIGKSVSKRMGTK